MNLGTVFFVVLVAIVVMRGVRVVPEAERVAVMRFGRYLGLRGPGLVLLIPYIDRAMRIELDKAVPEWRSLPPEVLERTLAERLTRG